MTILLFTSVALFLLLLLVAATRRARRQSDRSGGPPTFRNVDVAAFRTLINPNDDEYLRTHLAPAAFRRVRRARILAMQQYLSWMAHDCGVVLLLVHAQESNREQDFELQSLVRQAVRLRFTAMALWSFLWLQYAVPEFEGMPRAVANKYEALRQQAAIRLRLTEDFSEALA
jgi:hypothetical protein